MKRPKDIPGQSIRNFWRIKPQTRIHDNNRRKNTKQQRQTSRNELRDVGAEQE